MHTGARRSAVTDPFALQDVSSRGSHGSKRRASNIDADRPLSRPKSLDKIHVEIASGNRLLREALTRMLSKESDLEVHCVDWCGADYSQTSPELQERILLVSAKGDLTEDLERIQRARAAAPKLRILFLGLSADEKEFLRCVRAGVSGYLPQDASGEEVLKAIRALVAGESVCRGVHCGVLFRYFERESSALPSAAVRHKLGLTRREQQLIPLLAQGLTNKEIANRFSLSEQTIKNHVHRMKNKIGAEDRLDIVQLYRVQGFLV